MYIYIKMCHRIWLIAAWIQGKLWGLFYYSSLKWHKYCFRRDTQCIFKCKFYGKCHVYIKDDFMFGLSDVNKTAIIAKEIYGMKSSANTWGQYLATILKYELVYRQCYIENDI